MDSLEPNASAEGGVSILKKDCAPVKAVAMVVNVLPIAYYI
jgi:hypothetical protein